MHKGIGETIQELHQMGIVRSAHSAFDSLVWLLKTM